LKYVPFTNTTRENHYGGYSIEYLFTLVGNAIFNKLISRLDEDIEYNFCDNITNEKMEYNSQYSFVFHKKNNITSMT